MDFGHSSIRDAASRPRLLHYSLSLAAVVQPNVETLPGTNPPDFRKNSRFPTTLPYTPPEKKKSGGHFGKLLLHVDRGSACKHAIQRPLCKLLLTHEARKPLVGNPCRARRGTLVWGSLLCAFAHCG